jgi:predicted nucleotidyltransferase
MFGLKDETYKLIVDCLARFPSIDKAVIYGSRAMGTHHEGSDIDLALWGDISALNIAKISATLEDLPTLYKFDVLHYPSLDHVDLKAHIDRVGKEFYERKVSQSGYILGAAKEYTAGYKFMFFITFVALFSTAVCLSIGGSNDFFRIFSYVGFFGVLLGTGVSIYEMNRKNKDAFLFFILNLVGLMFWGMQA